MSSLPPSTPKSNRPPELGALSTALVRPSFHDEPIRILIVDDEPKNLIALETVLDHPGYLLVRAESADQALLALVAQEFALLILDIQMPGMNGFELAQMVKQRKKTASVPIIFLTAFYSEDQHVLEGYSTGAVDYLHKPINATVLRSKVAVFAELHRKTRESAMANRTLTVEVAERQHAQEELRRLNAELEARVAVRTAALVESEGRFRALAEDMPHLVWETDAKGITTFENLKWRAYTGLSQQPSRDGWLAALHPDDVLPMTAAWSTSLQTGAECDTHCRYRRASDGSFRWFRIKAAPVRDARGRIIRWVGTGTDIHEQRQAEEAMREADKRKDEFLAMLGHELRNPLAAIRHAVCIESESGDDLSAHQWASEVIDRQSLQLARMVDDLLDVERINRGRIDLRPEVLVLDAVIARAVEVVQPMIEDKRHLLEIETEAGLQVKGDAARLQQVLVNLLSNAAKYTGEGGHIRLAAHRAGNQVVITLADNGVGLAPEVLPQVFDLFTQVHTSLDRAQGGLGIGLTVVKSLVEMHGGSISAESAGVNLGTTFSVRLPILANPTRASATAGSAPSRAQTPAGAGEPAVLRVLVVDDHRDAAETLARLLTRRGCEVFLAHDGIAGLEAAEKHHPDVMLLDLGLPGLDGFELCRAIRAEPSLARATVIAISGYAQKSDIERSLEAGFDDHFAKPVDLAKLFAAFRDPPRH